jgi:hypothetical protein
MAEPYIPARPFGCTVEDLELDFASGDRPALITSLLAACTEPHDESRCWRLRVGERIAALLAVLRETEQSDALSLTLRCAHCKELFEISLQHAALAGLRTHAPNVQLTREGSPPLVLRMPTGDDLRAWRTQLPAPCEVAADIMLATLRVAGEIRPGDAAHAADVLAEADPLVSFSIACSCPNCGAKFDSPVDLEAAALQRLAGQQRALLREVLALASRFGWSEQEIFAVAPARRKKYLQMIAELA